MVVLPAASSPTIRMRISFLENNLPNTCARKHACGVREKAPRVPYLALQMSVCACARTGSEVRGAARPACARPHGTAVT